MKHIGISFVFITLLLCSCNNSKPEGVNGTSVSKRTITKEMAYQGVSNYCHRVYDWSITEDENFDPSIMYVKMGDDTETEYHVIFRSYTGAFVHFYVDKTTGTTRIVEQAPTLDVEEETGTIDLFEYLKE
jgi:hypothetical protein